MRKRNYTIVGVSPKLAKKLERYEFENVRIFRNESTKEIQIKLPLTVFEAIKVRVELMIFNLRHSCILHLLNDSKGRRYRV